MKILRPTRAL